MAQVGDQKQAPRREKEGKRGKLAGVEKILLTSQNALRLASDRENTPVPPCSLLVSVSLLFIIFGCAGSLLLHVDFL